jgi:hypothetical protein
MSEQEQTTDQTPGYHRKPVPISETGRRFVKLPESTPSLRIVLQLSFGSEKPMLDSIQANKIRIMDCVNHKIQNDDRSEGIDPI